MQNAWTEILCILISYILGSIPFALIVGKAAKGADIRNFGSGNLGATNAAWVLGKRLGFLVFLGDAGKGALAVAIAHLLGSHIHPLLIGVAAVVGHCFPIFARFRGGKAIATTAGVLLIYDPIAFLIVFGVFFIVGLITKYVTLGSISVGITVSIYLLLTEGFMAFLGGLLYLLLLLYLHRSNIRNIISGVEPKLNDKTLKKDRL